jgi:hypothetical protein
MGLKPIEEQKLERVGLIKFFTPMWTKISMDTPAHLSTPSITAARHSNPTPNAVHAATHFQFTRRAASLSLSLTGGNSTAAEGAVRGCRSRQDGGVSGPGRR